MTSSTNSSQVIGPPRSESGWRRSTAPGGRGRRRGPGAAAPAGCRPRCRAGRTPRRRCAPPGRASATTIRCRAGSSASAVVTTSCTSRVSATCSGHSLGELPPAARVRVVGSLEPLGVDGRAGVVVGQARERHGPAVPDAAPLRLVDQDPVHPGPQRRLAAEPVEPLRARPARSPGRPPRPRPAGRHVLAGQPEHPAGPAVDEPRERPLVAGAQGGDERVVVATLLRRRPPPPWAERTGDAGPPSCQPRGGSESGRGGQRYSGFS